ncbi:MAG TPA: inositol-3-phosphate synthase, partial [Segetibacter sp.]|nr:inositol-3-phosphate synthase [Segetibacter sp.]
MKEKISPAEGKLGILMPGLGAVATTFIAGVEAVKKGLAQPIGSLTQMASIRLGKRTENRYPKVKDFVPLTDLHDVVFGGWDVYEDNVYKAAVHAKVLDKELLESIRPELEAIKPMTAVFDKSYIQNLDGTNVKTGATKYELALQVMHDIKSFQRENNCSRIVMVWCGSTEKYIEETAVHATIESFEEGLKSNNTLIAPSMIYAYAAIKSGVPFANGAPNLTCDIPALIDLAKETETPVG